MPLPLTPGHVLANRLRVILAALEAGITPDEISDACNLSRATIYREMAKIERLKAEARERRAT